jgi:hypothetical protein
MDSLERAKRFLAGKASRLAIAAVPLAALAVSVPAKAGAILDTTQCYATGLSGGYCTIIQAGPTGGNVQANWLQLYGQGAAYNASGSFALDFQPASGGFASGSFTASSIPVSWDFDVFSSGSQVNWNVYYEFDENDYSNIYSVSQSGSTTGSNSGTEVTGSASLAVPSGGSVNGYDIDVSFNSLSPFSVTIPSGSTADFNPASSVPEPATLLMTAAGGVMLLLGRKKRA